MKKYILNLLVSKIAIFGKISGCINLSESSKYMGFSKSNLHKKTILNQIPFYNPNRKISYLKRADLDQYTLSNRQETLDEIYEKASNFKIIERRRKL